LSAAARASVANRSAALKSPCSSARAEKNIADDTDQSSPLRRPQRSASSLQAAACGNMPWK
jgi:hypothetical protein